MAKNNRYTEKNNPVLSVLYVIVVLLLVAALVFMYKVYRDKRNAYSVLVEQASRTDAGYDIEARKAVDDATEEPNGEANESTVTLAPTDEPTPEPTAVATAEPTAAPEPTAVPEPTAAPEANAASEPTVEAKASDAAPEAFIPETEKEELVDKSLAQGIGAN